MHFSFGFNHSKTVTHIYLKADRVDINKIKFYGSTGVDSGEVASVSKLASLKGKCRIIQAQHCIILQGR